VRADFVELNQTVADDLKRTGMIFNDTDPSECRSTLCQERLLRAMEGDLRSPGLGATRNSLARGCDEVRARVEGAVGHIGRNKDRSQENKIRPGSQARLGTGWLDEGRPQIMEVLRWVGSAWPLRTES
jgi:hypothetical protein